MSKVSDFIFSHRWAMLPEAFEAMIEVVDRNMEVSPMDLAKSLHGSNWKNYIDEQGMPIPATFQALEAFNYPILEGTRGVSVAKNVAVLPVIGPLTPRSNFANSFSGAVSVQSLTYDFNAAINNPGVDTLIMVYDTPGGEITYISEFADQIYAARAKKEIISVVVGYGASAGYWLASAGKEIVMVDTSEVGSLGVVAAYRDTSEKEAKSGVKRYEIVSAQSPNKRLNPSSDVGRVAIQKIVDELADVFIGAVAKYRAIEPNDVLANYGQGGMFVGKDAVKRGLADRIGSLESVIEAQQAKQSITFFGGTMNISELRAQHPAVYEEAVALGRNEATDTHSVALKDATKSATSAGAESERNRIKAIKEVFAPGHEDLISAAIDDSTQTAESVSLNILAAQKTQREKIAKGIGVDGELLAETLTGVGTDTPEEKVSSEKTSIISAAVQAMNANR